MKNLLTFRKYKPPTQVPAPPIIQKDGISSKKSPSGNVFYSHLQPINLKWHNITFSTNDGTPILKSLSGTANSGELLAIMGPSGAGKSTLLNVLSGFKRPEVSGFITVNGSVHDMRKFQSCYVMQEDHLLPHLTVRESIQIAARLKIPSSVSNQDIEKAVEDCIDILGLREKQSSRANQLSGGQRKKLCIAQELVSKPNLIFLDEPTSGLDSFACLKCIELLKSLAQEGRTVICTIHQPNSRVFKLFDKLYMMTEGHCIYRGSTKNIIPFFTQHGLSCDTIHNPAEFLTEVATGEHGVWIQKLKHIFGGTEAILSPINGPPNCDEPVEELDHVSNLRMIDNHSKIKSSHFKDNNLEINYSGCATSPWNQFKELTHRSFICTLREPMATQIRFFTQVLMSFFTGLLFYDIGNDANKIFNNFAFLFISLLLQVYTSMMPTLLTFPLEKAIFAREHSNKWYSTRMYYLAKTLSEIPFQILFPLIYCGFVYWMSSQPNDLFRFVIFTLSGIMISLVAQSFGFLIGSATSVQNAVFLGPVLTIPILMLSGFIMPLNKIPFYLQWLSYLSYTRYCFQSLATGIYGFERPPLHCDKFYCPFQEPEDFLSELAMDNGNLFVDFGAMWAFFFLFRAIAYYVLCFKVIYNR